MEFDYAHSPSYFSAALACSNNVFDQSFGIHDDQVASAKNIGLEIDGMLPEFKLAQSASQFPSPPRSVASFPEQPESLTCTFIDLAFNNRVPETTRQQLIQVLQPVSDAQSIPGSPWRNHGLTTPISKAVLPELRIQDKSAPSTPQQPHAQTSKHLPEDVHNDKDCKQPSKTALKRGRKSRKQTSLSEEAKNEKRQEQLGRNCVAAFKCRQKKKEQISILDSQHRETQRRKESLSLLVNSLREEVLYLKGEVVKHADCDCAETRDYIQQESENLPFLPLSMQSPSSWQSKIESMVSSSSSYP